MPFVLAIDKGTTSSRRLIFNAKMKVVAAAQKEFPQYYPASGWVEHDPADPWSTALGAARAAVAKIGIRAAEIAAPLGVVA